MIDLNAAVYSKKRVKELTEEYLKLDGIKSPAGLAAHIGVDSGTLRRWMNGDSGTFSSVVDYAMTCIEKEIVENGLSGKYNASVAMFILKCVFGYRDRGDVQAKRTSVKVEVTEELEAYAV